MSKGAKDLIRRLLPKNPKVRLSASQALSHPWVREGGAAPQIPLCYNIVSSLERYSKQSPLKRLFFENFAVKWENQQEVLGPLRLPPPPPPPPPFLPPCVTPLLG